MCNFHILQQFRDFVSKNYADLSVESLAIRQPASFGSTAFFRSRSCVATENCLESFGAALASADIEWLAYPGSVTGDR